MRIFSYSLIVFVLVSSFIFASDKCCKHKKTIFVVIHAKVENNFPKIVSAVVKNTNEDAVSYGVRYVKVNKFFDKWDHASYLNVIASLWDDGFVTSDPPRSDILTIQKVKKMEN